MVFPRGLQKKLLGRIDGIDFRTIRYYLDNPKSEIQQIIVVQEGYALHEVAAFFTNTDLVEPEDFKEDFEALISAGAIKTDVSQISDKTFVKVIYRPPYYVVKIAE